MKKDRRPILSNKIIAIMERTLHIVQYLLLTTMKVIKQMEINNCLYI